MQAKAAPEALKASARLASSGKPSLPGAAMPPASKKFLAKLARAVNAATLTELDGALRRETEGQLKLLRTKDFAEGTRAFQQRRAAKFTGE